MTVRNQGTGDAGPSQTRVDFGSFGAVDLPTGPLVPGAQTDVSVGFPFGGFNPDCDFRIRADGTGAVSESDEGNNDASGICTG